MKFNKALIAGAAFLFSVSVQAAEDIKLKDNSEILGKWKLYAEAIALHKEKVELFSEWEFRKDGVIHTESNDRFGRTKTLKIDLKYAVEDGVIMKQKTPGRSKMERCRVLELDDSKLTMKCTFVYLFFKR
ncbi:MAG: hypothetical protein methR_P2856 [Methyloprofundus sp.]|nr:MAG: hypothetical protein methR_P2856 [Methyloprofundus sp.]